MVDKIENYCLLEKNDIESAVSNFYNEPVTISEMDVVLIDNVDTFESMFYMSLQIKVPKLMNLDSEEQIVSNYELFDDDKWSDLTIWKPVVFIGEDCIFAFDCSLFNTYRRLTSLSLQPKIYKK